jgi:hypothetical protein
MHCTRCSPPCFASTNRNLDPRDLVGRSCYNDIKLLMAHGETERRMATDRLRIRR